MEELFGWAFGVRRVGDDDIELILPLGHILIAITYDRLDARVLETNAHAREVFLRDSDHSLELVSVGGAMFN